MPLLDAEITEVLFTEEQIRARVSDLARQITADYKNLIWKYGLGHEEEASGNGDAA